MTEQENIYSREDKLSEITYKGNNYYRNLIPDVTVIGLGGIGSWIALDMAMTGSYHIILVDPDNIELHNLNRTPFKEIQVGMNKARAMYELIIERRSPHIEIYDKFYQSLPRDVKKRINASYIIDCRDSLEQLPYESKDVIYLRYDGISMTVMDELPDPAFTDRTNGYTITPSILMPPQLLSAIATQIILYRIPFRTSTFSTLDVLEKLGIMR